ncbi:MAG: SurA N-terminal domain-containing protein [Gammaproteobacteria bacterium]|nr:SurA N-terminal domain-containing protein [Gammaproteobacteria bacterium]
MLQTIRDQVKGWLAVVIFTIMIIPFAFWGINYYFDQSGGVTVIDVNGEEISLADYQSAYQDIRQQWQSITGAPVGEETEALIKQRATEDLIQTALLNQAGNEAGLFVGEEEVWEIIRQIPQFNDDQGFNIAQFELAANRNGLSPAGFLTRIRQDMAIEQLRSALFATDFVTGSELTALSGIMHQTRDFVWSTISSDELKETIEVTDEQVQSYFDEEGRFMDPEQVRIAYLVLSLAKIAEEVYLEEGELESYFSDNRHNYEVEGTRNIRQVFVKLPEEPSEAEVGEMRAKADELYALVSGGEDMEEVVVNESGEHGDSIEFSEFGFLTKGALEPEADEVAFSMAAGEISEPVQSAVGFHIMAVDEIQGGTEAALVDIREEVEQDLREEKAAQQLYELSDRLSVLTYESPDTLDIAAEELELQVQKSDFISREDPGVGIVSEPGVVETAFTDEVLLEENNSELIELDNDRYMVLRVLEHRLPMKQLLEDVRDEIVTRLKFEQARDRTREQGEAVLEQLELGKSKEEVALEFGLNWNNATDVTQDDETINRAVLRTAFRAGVPEADQPLHDGASLGTGDYTVVIVYSVNEADPDAINEDEQNIVRSQLLQATTASAWAEFNRNLRAKADVTVYEDML